jgi:hypothetical protein
MNDDFLTTLRADPDPEFADALWNRLNQPPENVAQRSTEVTALTNRKPSVSFMRPVLIAFGALIIAGLLTLTVSPDARAALRDVWQHIGGTSYHEQNSPSIIDVTPPAGASQQSGDVLPTPAIGSGLPLPYKEAAALHRAHGFKLPSAVPSGYTAEATASANAGTPQGISEFRWHGPAGQTLVFDALVRPAGRNDSVFPVGAGAMTSLKVGDIAAAYIQGDWDDNGHWDPEASSRLVWSEGNVDYQLSTNDPALRMGDLLTVAESNR